MPKNKETKGTLKPNEIHPAADSALEFVKYFLKSDLNRCFRIRESFASTAIAGNRLSEVCLETLNRILNGDAISDRYLLGLAWTLMSLNKIEEQMNEEEVIKK